MLFNSGEFVGVFLPVTLAGFFLLGARGYRGAAIAWLLVASLFFYGWWEIRYLFLLGGSIIFNFSGSSHKCMHDSGVVSPTQASA